MGTTVAVAVAVAGAAVAAVVVAAVAAATVVAAVAEVSLTSREPGRLTAYSHSYFLSLLYVCVCRGVYVCVVRLCVRIIPIRVRFPSALN